MRTFKGAGDASIGERRKIPHGIVPAKPTPVHNQTVDIQY